MPPVARPSSRLLPSFLAAAAVISAAAAPTALAASSQRIQGDAVYECRTPAGELVSTTYLTLVADAPQVTRPGETVALTNVEGTLLISGRPTVPAPYVRGRFSSLGLTVAGATPATKTVTADAGATFEGARSTPSGSTSSRYAELSFDLPDVTGLATSGEDPVVLTGGTIEYVVSYADGPDAPGGAETTISCTAVPLALNRYLAVPSAPGSAGEQTFDATVAYQCKRGTAAAEDVTLRVRGTLPQTVTAGGRIALAGASVDLRKEDGPSGTSANYIWGYTNNLRLTASGTQDIVFPGGVFQFARAAGGGYGSGPVRMFDQTLTPAVTSTGGPLALSLSAFQYGYDTKTNANDPVPPYIPSGITCTPVAGQPPVATIAAAATPVRLPVVNRVQGGGFAFIGGIAVLSGNRLAGTTSVKVGTKSVRPLLVLGNTDVVVSLPGLRKGVYPVSATTAAGTSVTTASTTITFR